MANYFHLAIPAYNLKESREFYVFFLNSKIGRENTRAIIINFFDHQIVLHKTENPPIKPPSIYPNHFGFIFGSLDSWTSLLKNLKAKKAPFHQAEKCRHKHKPTEHHTFFLQDPSFNILEFKFYQNVEAIFGSTNENLIGDLNKSL